MGSAPSSGAPFDGVGTLLVPWGGFLALNPHGRAQRSQSPWRADQVVRLGRNEAAPRTRVLSPPVAHKSPR